MVEHCVYREMVNRHTKRSVRFMDQSNNKKTSMDLGNTYMGARSLIMKVERDELVEEIMNDYIAFNHWEKK